MHFFISHLNLTENFPFNSLFHTVEYKNHSVGYIFHTVRYKFHNVKQKIQKDDASYITKDFNVYFQVISYLFII